MPNSDPLRLNLGSGGIAVPGWVCIDRSPNIWLSRYPRVKRLLRRVGILADGHMAQWDPEIVRGDVRSLPYADDSVDAIYSSHMLEHIYLDDARRVVVEAHRVLRKGGVIRLALPDATENARDLIAGEEAGDAGAGDSFNYHLLAHPTQKPALVRSMVGKTGAHTHLWQPTPSMVKAMLEQAGFEAVVRRTYRVGDLPDVDTIETRPEGFHMEARAT